jgi:hypothetical protein
MPSFTGRTVELSPVQLSGFFVAIVLTVREKRCGDDSLPMHGRFRRGAPRPAVRRANLATVRGSFFDDI